MRHRRSTLRLNQKPDHAALLKRNLVTSLLLYESIRTTRKRARVIQPLIDRLIAMAKRKGGHVAIRAINRVVTDKNASRKIMEVFIQRYATRPSGFTRIVPVGARKGDGAELVDLSLIDAVVPVAGATAGEKKTTKTTKTKKTKKDSSSSSSSSTSSSSSQS